jgi:hypothetical protein
MMLHHTNVTTSDPVRGFSAMSSAYLPSHSKSVSAICRAGDREDVRLKRPFEMFVLPSKQMRGVTYHK